MAHNFKVCIIGLGPAGLGAALCLSNTPIASEVVCFEAGGLVEERICSIQNMSDCTSDKVCHAVMGVGGAAAQSGCKFSVYPAGRGMVPFVGNEDECRIKLESTLRLISEYIPMIPPSCGKPNLTEAVSEFERLGFDFRHYDSYLGRHDDLAPAFNKMLRKLNSAGVNVYLKSAVKRIIPLDGRYKIVATNSCGNIEVTCDRIILAVGRSGMDLLSSLNGVLVQQSIANRCDMGVRLEFPTSVWPDIDRYHNDLKLHFGNAAIGEAQTFCVAKNGILAPYRVGRFLVVDGHVNAGIDTGLTNLAIMVRQNPTTKYEHESLLNDLEKRMLTQSGGALIKQDLPSFLLRETSGKNKFNGFKSSIDCCKYGSIEQCFPEEVAEKIWKAVSYFSARLIPKQSNEQVFVFAPAIEYYWPKFHLNSDFMLGDKKLYLIGDCTGHFRGILQAYCSGLLCAESVVEKSYV